MKGGVNSSREISKRREIILHVCILKFSMQLEINIY